MTYKLLPNYNDYSKEERYEMITHYLVTDPKGHYVVMGYVDDDGWFVSVLLTKHKSAAKRKFKEYTYDKRGSTQN